MPETIRETYEYEKFTIRKINTEGDIEITKIPKAGEREIKMLIESRYLADIVRKLQAEIASDFVRPVVSDTG